MPRSPMSKFIAHVAVMSNDCWLWTGTLDAQGYGKCDHAGSRGRMAHRVGYELLRGAIPDGLVLDHLCRFRQCVNPWHLEIVTQRENVLRGESPSARYAVKVGCGKPGHPDSFDVVRGLPGKKQNRSCTKCEAERQARYKKRRKDEQ